MDDITYSYGVASGAIYTTPSAYRTLTMASGANLTVNGSLNVGGKQSAEQRHAGYVSGPYGCINMSANSTITMNSGSTLYAWGYIIGSGSVVAKSGSTVNENFQLADYRGGDVTSDITQSHKDKDLFPMSQWTHFYFCYGGGWSTEQSADYRS